MRTNVRGLGGRPPSPTCPKSGAPRRRIDPAVRQLRRDLAALGRLTNARDTGDEWGSRVAALLDRSIASLTAVIDRLEAGATVPGSEDLAALQGRLPCLSAFADRVAERSGLARGA